MSGKALNKVRFYGVFFSAVLIFVFVFKLYTDNEVEEGALDGNTFEIVLKSANNNFNGGDPDKLIFENGYFESVECSKLGFEKAPYQAGERDEKIKFESTLESEDKGRIEWIGTVDGDRITGSMIWHKEGVDQPELYIFKGMKVTESVEG